MNKAKANNHLYLWLLAVTFALLAGCATHPVDKRDTVSISKAEPASGVGLKDQLESLVSGLRPGERVAVSVIYHELTGDITRLGDHWRDRIENSLIRMGVNVVARRDVPIVVEDTEVYGGLNGGLETLLQRAGADVVVSGSYLLEDEENGKQFITLSLRATRVADGGRVGVATTRALLNPSYERLHYEVLDNVWKAKVMDIVSEDEQNGPVLSARLDRDPPCYPPGVPANLTVETEPGVHLYIFDIAADNTVTIVYPNGFLKDIPLPSGRFVFPPPEFQGRMDLVFYPLKPGTLNHEYLKIVASRTPIDFSFLPCSENRMYYGKDGGDLKRLLDKLRATKGWSQVLLSYGVGAGCD